MNYKTQILNKKQRYIDSLTTEQFDRLRVWIETNITVGETVSNLFHTRIDNKMQLARPTADRSLNDFQKNAKKRVINISYKPHIYRYGAIYASVSNQCRKSIGGHVYVSQ